MTDGLAPTEEYDGSVTVHILRDTAPTERVPCSSYQEAIATVKEENASATATKIESRDGEIVFTSDEMDIEDWEGEWKRAKRRLSVDVETHDCPYESVGCVADDLCVRCKMDMAQEQF